LSGLAGTEAARRCGNCDLPLSRYNTEAFCGGCATGNRDHPVANTGDIGARLRTLRRQRGMSQTVLGDLCGVSGAYVSMVENGKRKLDRWSMIVALAHAMRIPPVELALEANASAEGKEDSR
jgi:DNA-binding XRE family transcriptional regulator